jgi:hypothetical protein
MPHRDQMWCVSSLPFSQGRLTPVRMAALYCQKWGLEVLADPAEGSWIAGPAHKKTKTITSVQPDEASETR